jgi:hypothetical protein
VRDGLKQARAALRRGAADETLVLLWNELEPARIAGDQRALRAIGGLASVIVQHGDEGQRAEAEQLLAEVREAGARGAATAMLEGEVRPGGYEPGGVAGDLAGDGGSAEEDREEGIEQPGFRLGPLVWLLILIAIVIINVLGQARD